ALSLLPLAEAVTLGFTRILFLIPLAVLILGDRVDLPRWIATLIGFGGIVLMVDPSDTDLPAGGVALALGAALIVAGVKLTVKALAETEATLTIQLWFAGFATLATLVPALFVWRWPEPFELLLLLAIGGAGTLGQVFTVLGLRGVQPSAVMPVDYTRLIFATFYGFLLFGQLPAAATITGACVIVAATLFIARRGERVATAQLGLIRRR
ncbi:MAG: DMT family transporter, partial [Rhodospirillales bacterium]|nr:DMT family transporter [Rhodospirillales bacterium]